jgi:DNA invertase Pin-like site-specific DNA recombinase
MLVELVSGFGERGIGLKVLTGAPIDTTTPAGKLVFAIFAGLAEFERELIRERVNAGLAAAREEGRIGGRPKLEDARVHELRGRLERRQSWRTIAREMGISQATISRYAKRETGDAQTSGAK